MFKDDDLFLIKEKEVRLFADIFPATAITVRSRLHHAPAFKRCCDSCINVPCKVLNRVPCLAQEKQENVCEENGCTDIENCDEICQHSRLFSPLQMQEAKDAAARAAREEIRNQLIAMKESQGKHDGYIGVVLDPIIESLRGELR